MSVTSSVMLSSPLSPPPLRSSLSGPSADLPAENYPIVPPTATGGTSTPDPPQPKTQTLRPTALLNAASLIPRSDDKTTPRSPGTSGRRSVVENRPEGGPPPTARSKRATIATTGGKRDSNSDGKVSQTRRLSTRAPRVRAHRASVGGATLREGSPIPPPLAAKDKRSTKKRQSEQAKKESSLNSLKSAEKAASASVEGPRISPALSKEEGGPRERDASRSPSMIAKDELLEVLQGQNRDLARESVALRKALLEHISKDELLALLSGVATGAPESSFPPLIQPEASASPQPCLNTQASPDKKQRPSRHLSRPCVGKFFEVLKCCGGGPPVEETSSVYSDTPFNAHPEGNLAATDEMPKRSSITSGLCGSFPKNQGEQSTTKHHDDATLIAVDFFPFGPSGDDAATQTDPQLVDTESHTVTSEITSPTISVDRRPSSRKVQCVETKPVQSRAPRQETSQLPPNFDLRSAFLLNIQSTFPLTSMLPQSPYANPCLLPLTAINGDPLWIVSRLRSSLRGSIMQSPHPSQALAGIWGVWSEYLRQLEALKKQVDSATSLYKKNNEKSKTDACVQMDFEPVMVSPPQPQAASTPGPQAGETRTPESSKAHPQRGPSILSSKMGPPLKQYSLESFGKGSTESLEVGNSFGSFTSPSRWVTRKPSVGSSVGSTRDLFTALKGSYATEKQESFRRKLASKRGPPFS